MEYLSNIDTLDDTTYLDKPKDAIAKRILMDTALRYVRERRKDDALWVFTKIGEVAGRLSMETPHEPNRARRTNSFPPVPGLERFTVLEDAQ